MHTDPRSRTIDSNYFRETEKPWTRKSFGVTSYESDNFILIGEFLDLLFISRCFIDELRF
jgi:hypothetical protein